MSDEQQTDPAPLVLVVDDVAHGREIFAEYLEFRGFRVATAADGLEALDKAFELMPDLEVVGEPDRLLSSFVNGIKRMRVRVGQG